MQEDRRLLVARISAEISTSASLNEACRWLIECQYSPVRLDPGHLPALGLHSWLRVARPITAARAVLCTLWLVEELDASGCLLAGHLRFVAHPTASDVRLTFDGRAVSHGRETNPALQLLELIADAIDSRTIPLSAAG